MTSDKGTRAVAKLIEHCLRERDPDGLQKLVALVTRWSTTITPDDMVDMLNASLDAMPEPVRRWWYFHTFNSPDGGHARDN